MAPTMERRRVFREYFAFCGKTGKSCALRRRHLPDAICDMNGYGALFRFKRDGLRA